MKSNLKRKDSIEIEENTINKKHNKKKETKKSPNYDLNYGIIKTIREEITISQKPPKNTISELVFNNSFEELEKILKIKKTHPDTRDEKGVTCSWTPLYWSVKLRKPDFARLLLSYGANINMVIHDFEECCGTVLDLATLREDNEMELILREFAEKDDINFGQAFTAIRTKLRGKAPAFNFKYYGKKKQENE